MPQARVGLKADGTPCLRCQKTESGFCYQHVDQAAQHSPAPPAVVATVTVADKQRPKAAAADELPARRVGLKKDGTPCLSCVKSASGFCGQHLDQAEDAGSMPRPKVLLTTAAPTAEQRTSTATSSTSKQTEVDTKNSTNPKAPSKAPSRGEQQGASKTNPPKGDTGSSRAGAKQQEPEASSEDEEDSGEEGEGDFEDVEHATLVLGAKYPKFRRDACWESLEAERWRGKGAPRISNVVKSGEDSRNWLDDWARMTGRDKDLQTCAAAGCMASGSRGDRMVGGHVWVEGELGVRHCFIVPICSHHNNHHDKYDYPNWFTSKPDIFLMRITTRREFVRGRCKPGEKRIYRFEMRVRQDP